MKYGYGRVSTDGQSVEAARQPARAGCKKVLHEVAGGGKTYRAQLRRVIDTLRPGDVLTATRLDRPARSTCDLLNTLAAIMVRKPEITPQQEEVRRRDSPTGAKANSGPKQ